MSTHRIHRFINRMSTHERPNSKENERPAAVPPGFTVCPLHVAVAQAWQQEMYRQAYEQALAATQVPRIYRRMFPTWN